MVVFLGFLFVGNSHGHDHGLAPAGEGQEAAAALASGTAAAVTTVAATKTAAASSNPDALGLSLIHGVLELGTSGADGSLLVDSSLAGTGEALLGGGELVTVAAQPALSADLTAVLVEEEGVLVEESSGGEPSESFSEPLALMGSLCGCKENVRELQRSCISGSTIKLSTKITYSHVVVVSLGAEGTSLLHDKVSARSAHSLHGLVGQLGTGVLLSAQSHSLAQLGLGGLCGERKVSTLYWLLWS